MNSGSHTTPSASEKGNLPSPDPSESPLPNSTLSKSLAALILKYLEGRGIILAIEAREASQQVVVMILWLLMSAMAAFAGWLLLAVSLVEALSARSGWSWAMASATVGSAHIVIALGLALAVMKRLSSARWFPDSINEIKKDRTWLRKQTPMI